MDESSSKRVSVRFKDKFFLSETTLKYCMQEAEVVRLRRIEGEWKNIIPEIVPMDQGMNDIVELRLRSISQLQCLIDSKLAQVSKVFSKLVVLELEGMDNLEELCNGPLSFDSLNSLEKLSISDCKHLKSLFKCNLNLFNLKSVEFYRCPMLISLFQMSTAQSLVLLERLEIDDCEGLENIIIDERKGEESRAEIIDDNESTSQGSMFQKLKVLSIENCPRIELILPFQSAHDLPALKIISIRSCDKLQYIFGQDVKIGSLKMMVLVGIPNFIDIFPECNPTISLSIKKPSSISEPQEQSEAIKCNMFSWTNIYSCGKKYGNTSTKIPMVSESEDQQQGNLMESKSYPINIWERAQCLSRQSHIISNIKEITLRNISKIKSVFILSIAPRMLLETLWIKNCDELKHIILDTGDHDNTVGNNWGTVFPNLRNVKVEDCEKLEYIIGHFTDDHQNHTEIHLHLPALKSFTLRNLPSLVAMCPKQYRTTFPPLKELVLNNCRDNKIIKELSWNVDHFHALERLIVKNNSKVESIICLNEINEQQMNLALEDIDLDVLPMMTCLFVGPKNSFFLQNLTRLIITRCEKLKIVFSTSIIRYLPQLLILRIEECNELKHIIEDDLESKNSSNFMSTTKTCFPKLRSLFVVKCNKLNHVFPISVCKELPALNYLIIREANELEEIFVSEGDDHKVEIPNLKYLVFENLPSLSHAQGIHFQAVKHRFIQRCQKLSLASAITADLEYDLYPDSVTWFVRHFFSNNDYEWELEDYLRALFRQLQKETKGQDSGNENSETSKDFAPGVEVKASSEHELTSPKKTKQTLETEHELVENVLDLEIPTNSKDLMNEQSMDQQRPLEETDTAVKPSQVNEISVEKGITSANAKRTTASSQECGDGEIAIPSSPIAITNPLTTQDVDINTNDVQVSLNDDTVIKVTSIVEEQLSKDVEFKVPEPKLSPIIPSPQEFRTPSMLFKGDPSQKVEDLSSSLLVKSELKELVSKNHLDCENLSLLTAFLVKNPSVRLKDIALSNRYKGCAYTLLAELLKFLETHSVLEVLGSCHSKFVELLQDACSFGFDKDWLNGVERRTLFPEIQVSQDALQKLLDSKQQVTKDVEVLRLKIGILSEQMEVLSEQVEDLKQQLTSSEAVLESIFQQEVVLRAPIGY